MYLGLDLGTSAVKAVLVDEAGSVVASASCALSISHPKPLWSEQNPHDWWRAAQAVIDNVLTLAKCDGISPERIAALGLSGQMHGATLLDSAARVLRPAILWNDGRSANECRALEATPQFWELTGNLAMPGFTAPKLLWLRAHEPRLFDQISKVLLPKDYLRLMLSGDYATDVSDASGTLWLDVKRRRFSSVLLEACGLSLEAMPSLHEGDEVTGQLSRALAERWGMKRVPIAAGGGDNAAGAVGVGIVRAGQAMLSLGTSGVYFAVGDRYHTRVEQAVHGFCHALPGRWHLMSVMLSAASCLDFCADVTGYANVGDLLGDAEREGLRREGPLFLPYLNGERTPHNDPYAAGAFSGLRADTRRTDLAHAVLEGVGLGLLDGIAAVDAAGLSPTEITVIGGGSRSSYWVQMLADIVGRPLTRRAGADVGPALGAARLARLAVEPSATASEICSPPALLEVCEPNEANHAYYRERRQPRFRSLYRQLLPLYDESNVTPS